MVYLKRGIETELYRRMSVEPLVVLEGARATGKTRLLEHALESGQLKEVRSFLDEAELAAAKAAPSDYIQSLQHGTAIDEIQLCESILLPLKKRIENETPGAFVVTGSTRLKRNTLGGSDPLAGRTGSSLHLGTLTLGERAGLPVQLVKKLFDFEPTEIPLGDSVTRSDLAKMVFQPNLPGLLNLSDTDIGGRSQSYIRQVTSISPFTSLDIQKVNQLAIYLAGRTSTMLNINSYAGATEMARQTVENYLARLEEALLIIRLKGWRRSKDKSETDRPKLHFFDAGIASSLARMNPNSDVGKLVETMIANEIVHQCAWLPNPPQVYHWRRNENQEVDFVLEANDGRAICIEVKSAERVDLGSFKGIDAFREKHPTSFYRGFTFYSGAKVLPFGENRWAIPFSALMGKEKVQNKSIEAMAKVINKRRQEFKNKTENKKTAMEPYLAEAEKQLTELAVHFPKYVAKVTSDDGVVVLWIRHRKEKEFIQLVAVTTRMDNWTITVQVSRPYTTRINKNSPQELISALLAKATNDIARVLEKQDQKYS